jgi:hypothetical protein
MTKHGFKLTKYDVLQKRSKIYTKVRGDIYFFLPIII